MRSIAEVAVAVQGVLQVDPFRIFFQLIGSLGPGTRAGISGADLFHKRVSARHAPLGIAAQPEFSVMLHHLGDDHLVGFSNGGEPIVHDTAFELFLNGGGVGDLRR